MKVVDAELEDFMDWVGIIPNEPAEEKEMSRLTMSPKLIYFLSIFMAYF